LVATVLPRGPHHVAVIRFFLVTSATPDVLSSKCIASASARPGLAASNLRWVVAFGRLRRACFGVFVFTSAVKIGASLLVATVLPRGPHHVAVIRFFLVTSATPDVLSRKCIASALAGNILAASPHRRVAACSWLRRV